MNTATDEDLREVMQLISVVPDGEEFIIGRADLDCYVAVPQPGAVFIRSLQDGDTLARAAALAGDAAGEEVDAHDFLAGLREAGLLDPPSTTQTHIGWVQRIPVAWVKPLFGKVAWAFYALIAIGMIVLLSMRPDLRPIFDDVWFLTDPIWSVLAIMVIAVVITAGHECWHWLAARALGVPARFRVSRRGVFIVFETDLSQLATLPRRMHYSPILAGFAFDVTLMALALGMRWGFREEVFHHSPELDRFFGAIVFRQLVVLIWQLAGVAFRTDSYVLLATMLGTHNLYRATGLTAKYRLWKLNADESEELAAMSQRDRSVANWFWLVYLVGGFTMFTVLTTYLAPFAFGMIVWIGPNITSMAPNTVAFWQSLAVVAILVGQYAIVPFLGIKDRRTAKRPASPRTVQHPHIRAWQLVFVVMTVAASIYAFGELRKFVEASSDASQDNALAAGHNETCLPGLGVRIMDFPHISQEEAKSVVYLSNPATSGPHYGAAVAPGIYRSYLPDGQTVHALEHGRVVIHYRPGTPADVVARLESIAKRYAKDTVVNQNPNLDTQIALTAWGRIDKMDTLDEPRVLAFVDKLRGRYDHHSTASSSECS